VVGYDTGALLELVGEEAGVIHLYGGDYLKLQPAHPVQLAQSALRVLSARKRFSANARCRAEKFFDLNTMVRRYLEALLPA
jgi:glycosyltransferase involved in cell wall biosynthesis